MLKLSFICKPSVRVNKVVMVREENLQQLYQRERECRETCSDEPTTFQGSGRDGIWFKLEDSFKVTDLKSMDLNSLQIWCSPTERQVLPIPGPRNAFSILMAQKKYLPKPRTSRYFDIYIEVLPINKQLIFYVYIYICIYFLQDMKSIHYKVTM